MNEKLTLLKEQIDARTYALDTLILEYETEAKEAVIVALQEKLVTYSPNALVIGDCWDCPTSPTGKCVYDHDEDECHDSCLFCGDPEERK